MAVPPMPVKWTDLISDENMAGKLTTKTQRHKVFWPTILQTSKSLSCAAFVRSTTSITPRSFAFTFNHLVRYVAVCPNKKKYLPRGKNGAPPAHMGQTTKRMQSFDA
jgi:hypothetical protein